MVAGCAHRVVGDEGALEGLLDDLEEGARHLLAVEHHPPAEEPVARVLRVGLAHVKALDVGGVALELGHEEVGVVVEVGLVEAEPHLLAHPLERRAALAHHRHHRHRLGRRVRREVAQWLGVDALGHPVVEHGGVAAHGRRIEGGLRREQITPRRLDALDLAQAARRTDGDGVGRPGRRKGQARPHLEQGLIGARRPDEARLRGEVRLERLGQQPEQPLLVGLGERRASFERHIEAQLVRHPDKLDRLGAKGGEQRRARCRRIATLVELYEAHPL